MTIWIGQKGNAWEQAYTVFGMVMTYFLPLLVIVITYAVILVTIYKKSKECESGMLYFRKKCSCCVNSICYQNCHHISILYNSDVGLRRSGAGVLNRARAKTLKMTVVIVSVFIFCWTPYYIIVLW